MPVPRSILTKADVTDHDLELVSGTWPADIGGHYLASTSDQRTHPVHAFFGDGIMARLALRPDSAGRFPWRARVIDTPSVRLRRKRPDLFTPGPVGTSSPWGFVNCANTAPLPWGDRLFATWDAGRPVEVDPVTLGFVAEVGHRDDWKPSIDQAVLPLISSSAHPVVDPERGCLWTVSRDVMSGAVSVIRYDGTGRHVRRWLVEGGVLPQATHTITQTRDWLVLADTAYKVDVDEVFDAADVGRGPVAVLAPARGGTVPFLIHSAWMPEAVPAPDGLDRLRFADDLDSRLDQLGPELAGVAREVAAELDGGLPTGGR